MTTHSQRQASQRYREKLKKDGCRQHLIYASDLQWAVIQPISNAIKQINLEGIQSVEVDDNGEFIHLIYDNRPETRFVSSNQTQDDKS